MQFEILAKNPNTGCVTNFYYDNSTNVISSKVTGIEYGRAPEDRDLTPYVPTYSKSKKITVLKIQLGLNCNYSCDYCSQANLSHADPTSAKDIENFIAQLEHLDLSDLSNVQMWGGEPFVYWKTLKPLTERLKQYFIQDLGIDPNFTVINNGSLLTEEIVDWLWENNFGVAVSHDGPNQHIRGEDPFDDPVKYKVLRDAYLRFNNLNEEGNWIPTNQPSKHSSWSFNAMLHGKSFSREQIHNWFKEKLNLKQVRMGEGGIITSYSSNSAEMSLSTKRDHFDFRKQCFSEIYANKIDITKLGFHLTTEKIAQFVDCLATHRPIEVIGQKCGMDSPNTIAVTLKGDVLACQNSSSLDTAIGNIENIEKSDQTNHATYFREKQKCLECPVVHLCKGDCFLTEGENEWVSCNNNYSDNIVFFAAAFEGVTGYIPMYIYSDKLPEMRKDIFGEQSEHNEIDKPLYSKKIIPIVPMSCKD